MTPAKAWGFTGINLLATPGLGTLLGRRYYAGGGQLFLALIGFFAFMFWFLQKMRVFYSQAFGSPLPAGTGDGIWKWGLIFFGMAWVWSLVSSVQMVFGAKKNPPPSPLPPVIPPRYP